MRCSFPQYRRNKKTGEWEVHACGNCHACRKRKQQEWGFRSFCESLYYPNNCIFLSLTYDDEHLKLSRQGYPTLSKSDVVNFKKRLGYYIGSFRFLLAGEYGDTTNRPHYHMLVFGCNVDDPVFYDEFWSPRKKAWIAKCKAWPFGEVCIADVSLRRCLYVAKYTVKRKTGKLAKAYYEDFGIEPEFLLMSRRPGLGHQYLLDNYNNLKIKGYVLLKNHKLSLPRNWEGKLYCTEEEKEKRHNEKVRQTNLAQDEFFKRVKLGDYSKFPRSRYFFMKDYLRQQDENLERMEKRK